MWREVSALLACVMIVENGGAAERPLVTFNPNWQKIFRGESIMMSCNVRSSYPEDTTYTWYKNDAPIYTGPTYIIENAEGHHGGSYQCKGANTEISDPVTLIVSNDWVILQVPLYVHEGDDLALRCHHYPGYSGGNSIFYKGKAVIRDWNIVSVIQIRNINHQYSGKYKCTKVMRSSSYSGDATVSVRELFTAPEIRASSVPVTEGNAMTLKCHTNVSPFILEPGLRFAFYKEGEMVQGFGSSDQYGRQFAQLEHSGKYHCEVKTSNERVIKRSSTRTMEIVELFAPPELILTPNPVAEGDNLTLTCHTTLVSVTGLQFAFYKDGRNIEEFSSSNLYGITFAQMNDSGNYSCKVQMSTKRLLKATKEIIVLVQELFSKPEIVMLQEEVAEGSSMTLTCNTSLKIHGRNASELQFAFYRDGARVREFSPSSQYDVPAARRQHSGNYSCKVRTSDRGVEKESEALEVTVQENNYLLIILPVALGVLLLTVAVLVVLYIRCHLRRSKPETETAIGFGEYTEEPEFIYTNVDLHQVSQTSTGFKQQTQEPEITYTDLNIHRMSQTVPVRTQEQNGKEVVYVDVKTKRKPAAAPDASDQPESIYQNF